MFETRSGEMVSAQIGKMGNIENLSNEDFSLFDGQNFCIKNDGINAVQLEVRLAGMNEDEFVRTTFNVGWNPEIVKTVKQTQVSNLELKWGY